MKIYKDIISGDELLSDSFPLVDIDDVAYEVETKMVTKSEGDYDIGANPSAEGGGDDGFDKTSEQVNNLVDAMRLQMTSFDKKSYMGYIKAYMKSIVDKLKETNPDRVKVFQEKIQPFIKKILGSFDEYTFYTGENMDPEAMVAMMFYKEDGITPYFYFFKDGLVEEKV